ncbi:MAG: ABC transporter ATP-binding protein [Simkaniaceae bacterium]|nr:ABC transporter ATP-binding protein [Candidatus Sacchlamyda saccharinae]
MAVLSVRNLRKVYPGKKPFTAVDGISFDLEEGEILGLLGPNGAGKTTTIQMLMSTLKSSSGEILYFGKDLAKHRSEVLQHVTFASTYLSLPWNLSVEQNLDVFGRLFSLSPREFNKTRDELLERFGILGKKRERVASLSSGQITRLMLVKAFMVKPRIVLLDEPTASLDPDVSKEVIGFISDQRKNSGVSVLFTSHNMAEVSELCDRVLFLKKGKIFADDLPQNLINRVSKNRINLVIVEGAERAVKIAENLQMEAAQEGKSIQLKLDENQIAQYLASLAEAKISYSNISINQPTLEDFFHHVAKEEK